MAVILTPGTPQILFRTLSDATNPAAELVNWVKDSLVSAGWAVISGSSGDWYVKSKTDSASRFFSFRLRAENTTTALFSEINSINQITTSNIHVSGRCKAFIELRWKLITQDYQFFLYGLSLNRSGICGGLYFPYGYNNFFPLASWFFAMNSSGADTGEKSSLFNTFASDTAVIAASGVLGRGQQIQGRVDFDVPYGTRYSMAFDEAFMVPIYDPVIRRSGSTTFNSGPEIRHRLGQLYDCFILGAHIPRGARITFKGKQYEILTAGGFGGTYDLSLAVRVT